MLVGCARVSTRDQVPTLQLEWLNAAGCDWESFRSVFTSAITSALPNRPSVVDHLARAQVISVRKVQGGLRRFLLTQAKRPEWLASGRYRALGGTASFPLGGDADGES